VCTGSSNKPKVNVNVTGTIQANPPNVCAQPGTTLNFSLAPTPTELNTYAVVPKDPSLFWLIKKNDTDPGTIKVQIPSAKIGEIFEYTIVANDGRCLDPMIEITD
jgi:hypothetical protein